MRECFGKIYPDLSRVQYNTEMAGKVFRLRINSFGLMHQAPQLEADLEEWADCQTCDVFRSCFDFSNARLAMQQTASRL